MRNAMNLILVAGTVAGNPHSFNLSASPTIKDFGPKK